LRPHCLLNRASAIAGTASAAGHPLGLDKDRIDRGARGHEQAVALPAAETDVGAALGQHDAADHLAVRGEHDDPVLGLAARPGAPQVAFGVDPHAIAAAGFGTVELAPVGGLGAVFDDIVN